MTANCRRTIALRQFFLWSVIIAVVLIACAFTHGCGPAVPTAAEMDDLNLKLAQCRAAARDAKDAGAPTVDAFMKYEDCKRRKGVQQ